MIMTIPLPRGTTLKNLYENRTFAKLILVFSVSIFFLFFILSTQDFIRDRRVFRPLVSYERISNSEQGDPYLISFLKENVIKNPSGQTYNLTHPEKEDFSQYGQGIYLEKYFKNLKNGTFVEAGAFDGEKFSNTLILERKYGWKGLLVEPNPSSFEELSFKQRKAHRSKCCLSEDQYTNEISFRLSSALSRIYHKSENNRNETIVKAYCYPLYSLLLAQNLTTLDLLTLDLEGSEVKVLKTLPWDKINIKHILVEVNHIPEGKAYLKSYMEEKNYVFKKLLRIDYFFVKKNA